MFDPHQRRQGIMTEALSLFVDYLFQSTKIHRVQLIIAEGNIASERVAQKCGFTYEGTGATSHVRTWEAPRHEALFAAPP